MHSHGDKDEIGHNWGMVRGSRRSENFTLTNVHNILKEARFSLKVSQYVQYRYTYTYFTIEQLLTIMHHYNYKIM